MSRTRSRKGCWTCRLRHRKCDESLPNCDECSTRHITCHGYDLEAPDWMSDDRLAQEELLRIKLAIRENFKHIKKVQNRQTADALAAAARSKPSIAHAHDAASQSPTSTAIPREFAASTTTAIGATFKEAQYLVHYLDYIFWLQFPHYVDAPDRGGRAWLYWLLSQSPPLRNAALTLSAYHQHIISRYRTEHHEAELLRYHTRALQDLRQVLCRREVSRSGCGREDWIELTASGLFLLSFEVFQGGTGTWEPHLNALVLVARELTPSDVGRESPTTSTFQGLDRDFHHGLETTQKFMIVNVLWFEIISCVCTADAPKTPYRQWLQGDKIDMACIMGCQNSTMLAIGDMAALEAGAVAMGRDELRSGISELEARICQLINNVEPGVEDLRPRTRTVTRLYATAALVHLYTIAAEFKVPAPDPSDAVGRVVDALEQGDEGFSARGLPWVMCIAGAMAPPHQQHVFADTLQGILDKSASGFTNCDTVLHIITHAWKQQSGFPDCTWTARRAMEDLGISALLI